eukprot:scaffold42284_cov49-Prasinocladus_malaysianus.AAC.3
MGKLERRKRHSTPLSNYLAPNTEGGRPKPPSASSAKQWATRRIPWQARVESSRQGRYKTFNQAKLYMYGAKGLCSLGSHP